MLEMCDLIMPPTSRALHHICKFSQVSCSVLHVNLSFLPCCRRAASQRRTCGAACSRCAMW